MSRLISRATGNWTASSTWALSDPTFVGDAGGSDVLLTTSLTASNTATPGAITVDGYAIRVSYIPLISGTMTVEFYNSTDAVVVATTTINVSDIPYDVQGYSGWLVFPMSSTLLTAGKAYAVRAKTSVANTVALRRNAGTNYDKQLRTTTQQAPAVGDQMYMCGEYTGAGTGNSFVITVDNTTTTAWGTSYVCGRATLAYGIAAATNYYLRFTGDLDIQSGGTLKMATKSGRLPADSTQVLEFNSSSAGQYGLILRDTATWNFGGDNSRVTRTFLTADEAAAQTVIGPLVSTSGWRVSDELAFPSTTQTASQGEKKTILTVDSGTQVTLTAGLTNAHSGTNASGYDNRCEVANLTRNVKIRGVNATTGTGYIETWASTVIDGDYLECYNMGAAAKGLRVNGNTSAISIENSSFHEMNISGAFGVTIVRSGGTNDSISVKNNVFYDCATAINVTASTSRSIIDGNFIIRGTNGITANDVGSTYINNKTTSCSGVGINFSESGATIGTFTDHISHSNGSDGIKFTFGTRLNGAGNNTNVKSFRNGGYGIQLAAFNDAIETYHTMENWTLYGNASGGAQIYNNSSGELVFKNWVVNAGLTLAQASGLVIGPFHFDMLTLDGCSFGATTAHATADINFASFNMCAISMYNTTLASTGKEVVGYNTTMPHGSEMYRGIWSFKHNGVAGSVQNWRKYGIVSLDTVRYKTAAPGLKCVPNSASFKQFFANKVVPIASGSTVTVSAYVWKSTTVGSADASTYNGNQPRLMVKKNLAIGITADTVIATASGAAGAWELLTGASPTATADGSVEFFIDCDGTAGFVSVDDMTTTATTDPSGMKYWFMGLPALDGANPGGSSADPAYGFC